MTSPQSEGDTSQGDAIVIHLPRRQLLQSMMSDLSEDLSVGDHNIDGSARSILPTLEEGSVWVQEGDIISPLDRSSPSTIIPIYEEESPEPGMARSAADLAGNDLSIVKQDILHTLRDELDALAAARAKYPPHSPAARLLHSYMAQVGDELDALARQDEGGGVLRRRTLDVDGRAAAPRGPAPPRRDDGAPAPCPDADGGGGRPASSEEGEDDAGPPHRGRTAPGPRAGSSGGGAGGPEAAEAPEITPQAQGSPHTQETALHSTVVQLVRAITATIVRSGALMLTHESDPRAMNSQIVGCDETFPE